jgi:beta-xylosidase
MTRNRIVYWRIVFRLFICMGMAVAAQCQLVPQSVAKAATTYQNPVINADFPEPDVIMTHGTYYAYATSSGGKNIQVASSTDFVHWTLLPDALPTLPSWSSSSLTWARRSFKLATSS